MTEQQQFRFTVPNEQWESVEPPEGQLFMIMRKGDFAVYRPNISVDMSPLQPDATVEDAANITPQRLANMGDGATLAGREVLKPHDATVVKQRIDFTVKMADGTMLPLSQGQYYIELLPVERDETDAHGVLVFMLTCEPHDIELYGADFNKFIESIEAV